MSVSEKINAIVVSGTQSLSLSSYFTITGSNGPAFLVVSALDRDEYTAAATGATGHFSDGSATGSLTSVDGDGRGYSIIFTYNAATGQYTNATFGNLSALTYTSSASLYDLTNISLYGETSLSAAQAYASDPYALMQEDSTGYLGSISVSTDPHFSGTVPSQATPDSIAATAARFVGDAWNMDGCWVLASTIAAESGASLPVQSTAIGVPGAANGEWFVAYNGPAGASGNWLNMIHTGDIIAFETASGGGHITTCVSGSGASAMLIDNITYENGNGSIENSANDGSANDILISAAHPASQEFSGVNGAYLVIYQLDTPIVSDSSANLTLSADGSFSLASDFSATDPLGKSISGYQVYDSLSGACFLDAGALDSAHSAATALSVASLSQLTYDAASAGGTDTLEVRAFNGSYWGDWQTLTVVAPTAAAEPPVLSANTANQTWLQGSHVDLVLPATLFTDPLKLALALSAGGTGGAALPSWLSFNASTRTFSGTVPSGIGNFGVVVTATDSSGLSTSETFTVSVPAAAPLVTVKTASESWVAGSTVDAALPHTSFTDPQGETLTYSASLAGGAALPSWLSFSGDNLTFSGTAPLTPQTLKLVVTATDSSGLSTSETISTAITASAPVLAVRTTPAAVVVGGKVSFALASGSFTDPQGEALTYKATLAGGAALPSWLSFSADSLSFSGTAPITPQTDLVVVTATDGSGLSTSETLSLKITASAPVLAVHASSTSWEVNSAVGLSLPNGSFTDPQNESLTYKATLAGGAALPSWLKFSASTLSFSGTAPVTPQTLALVVTATDASGLSTAETITATIAGTAPGLVAAIAAQSWSENSAVDFTVPSGVFTDPQGETLSFSATTATGAALPSWLHFSASTMSFTGTAPATLENLQIKLTAKDSSGYSTSDVFTASIVAPSSGLSLADWAGAESAPALSAAPAHAITPLEAPPVHVGLLLVGHHF